MAVSVRQPIVDPELTIIVPTRNEAENVRPLLAAISQAVREPTIVCFVDDSDDATPDIVYTEMITGHPRITITLMHRKAPEREGGLGGAVVYGLTTCTTKWVCVMDGDLQHPPELVPQLLKAARLLNADLVVASRYVPGGKNDGLSPVRVFVSRASTRVAKLLFGRRLRGISDPMSGFFLFRREAVESNLKPRGFKILLEMAARHPHWDRSEIAFEFAERNAGESKGTMREGVRYLRQLLELRWSLYRTT